MVGKAHLLACITRKNQKGEWNDIHNEGRMEWTILILISTFHSNPFSTPFFQSKYNISSLIKLQDEKGQGVINIAGGIAHKPWAYNNNTLPRLFNEIQNQKN